jgi:hypothetical protein
MLRINPAPESFRSTAKRDVFSDNSGAEITTERLLETAKAVHREFDNKGLYDAIKESNLYSRGNATHE